MNDEAPTKQQVAVQKSEPLKHEIAMASDGRRRSLAPENASQAIQFAQLMARSDAAVPERFRNNPGLCLGVTMDAMIFGFNPFALARTAYVVSGAIGYEAKAYVAALNSSGFLRRKLKFTYSGEIKGTHRVKTKTGEIDVPAGTLKCKVVGDVVGEDEILEWETPELGSILQKGSPLWKSDPKLQLFYYGARAWARVHMPEVMLGIQTGDELQDIGGEQEPAAPKPTLIDRVKARREDAGDPVEVALPAPPAATEVEVEEVDAATEEPTPHKEVQAETAATDDPPPPAEQSAPEAEKPKRTRAKAKKDAPAEDPAPAPPADEPGRPQTTEEALDLLKVSVAEKNTREEVETAKLDWMLLITEFTRDEQFDLQAAADEIVARRRLAIGRKAAGG